MFQLYSKIGVQLAPAKLRLASGLKLLLITLCCVGMASAQQPNDHIFPGSASARPFISFDSKGFFINGKRTFLVSAGLEYARVPRALWADRLLRLQRAGFNCVEVYTFWNFHEPQEGVFQFSGDHDLGAFLGLVKQMGLYAIVRVGPYYCAEWDNGGYPLWLKFKPGLRVREPNAVFEKQVGLFFDKLFPIVTANQINRGGAVIMVQLENEHPLGWGTDMPNSYFTFLREKALSLGMEVPYFFSGLHHSSDPAADSERTPDKAPGNAAGNTAPGYAKLLDDAARPNPWFSTEFWSVWYNGYSSGEKEAKLYERRTWKIIAHGGAGYNYYMAHGGSNFGYTNNDEDAASYDYGAAVGQAGDLRPIYYSYKRAALFARSFAEELSTRGRDAQFNFLDNPSDTVMNQVVRPGDTVRLQPGEIIPVFKPLGPARILALCRQQAWRTFIVYGDAGSRITLTDPATHLPGRYVVPAGIEPKLYPMSHHVRLLVMNRATADRTWVIGDTIVVGPRYVGEMTMQRGRISIVTEDTVDALVYTAGGVHRLKRAALAPPMNGRGVLGDWRRQSTTAVTTPEYDASDWKYSEWPLQMGADGDSTADAWYRTTVAVDSPGIYTLLVEGADRATAFVDGQPGGAFSIKEGAIPLTLTKGQHILAVFTAHDGRDKLPAYIGALDSVARKGLFGRALLVKGGPVIGILTNWKMLKAVAAKKGEPGPGRAGPGTVNLFQFGRAFAEGRSYTIGEDAFDKKQDSGWFETVLPNPPAGVQQAELRFASVDENATVFVNGRQLLRHNGWNAPFNILLDRIDTMRRPILLSVFVSNYSNEGGIDQPVRFSPFVAPVEVKGWRMRGGMSAEQTTGPMADTTRVRSGPCWWTTTFTLPDNPGWLLVWRVIPDGLGHGSIWVNGHNLGRYPEKIPVNGLYIPECWLTPGKNSLVIFDEDGKDAHQVRVEAETAASRRVVYYK